MEGAEVGGLMFGAFLVVSLYWGVAFLIVSYLEKRKQQRKSK